MKTSTRILVTIPAIVLTSGIIAVSSQPNITLPDLNFVFLDKILHLIAYFGYGLSLQFAFKANFSGINGWKAMLIVLIFGALFCMTDEMHQSYVPGRSADFFDWVFDIMGISISLLFYKKIKYILNKN